MTYADTDFFLALFKERDWLKSNANRLLSQHHGQLWTSITSVIELLLLSTRYNLDPEAIIQNALRVAKLRHTDESVALLAAHFVKRYELTVFDAMHAAFCSNEKDAVLSSDAAFEKVGLERVPLEKE